MAGQLFTSTELDSDGRQTILDDDIRDVHYYSTVGESWDKVGAGNQSWFLENFIPNDSFDAAVIASDRWKIVDTPAFSDSTTTQADGKITLGVEKDEGIVALSSDSIWGLQGDFDVRLFLDWDSYYNEYRSLAYTFLKVGVDEENAVRVSFAFDGSGFAFVSEKTVDRSLTFFDWKDNGSASSVANIAAAQQYTFLQITRVSGVVKTFISDGVTATQVGNDITDAVFSGEVSLEFGVETKEFNTYRSGFTKVFVAEGTITPTIEFFSSSRGKLQSFPDRVIIVVDDIGISIIDEGTSKLWLRFLFGEGSAVLDNTTKVFGCNGVIYCTTSDGLVAYDFPQDKIFKYKDSSILVADETIALRNAGTTFRTFAGNIGTIPDNNLHDVACRTIGSEDYLAFTNDSGVTVIRALASGVATSSDGPLPGAKVEISDKGALYWSGYDQPSNDGELSFFSNIVALAGPGDTSFNRTDFYGVDTALNIFGANITAFDVRTVDGVDLVGVGTTEGITFIAFSPAAPFTGSVTYGVSSPADNPIVDPAFGNYLGLDWRSFVSGVLHEDFIIERNSTFSTEGSLSIHLRFLDLSASGFFEEDTTIGVYQDVDLTGVERVYFDIKLERNIEPDNFWDFEVVVGETVVKNYSDTEGDFTKFNDSTDVLSFSGVQRLKLQLRVVADGAPGLPSSRHVYVDNLRTKIGDPDHAVLPAGNASVKEVLLQYDDQGHKIYFSTAEGYGALDLDDNSIDYFIQLDAFGPDDTEVISSDFSRIEDEV